MAKNFRKKHTRALFLGKRCRQTCLEISWGSVAIQTMLFANVW